MSTFGGTGKATLTINNDKLIFVLKDNKPFIEANMSVPAVIVFDRIITE